MATLIQGKGNLKEGEFFMKWLNSRLLVNNKNVLGAELGATGSGKSYRDLRKVELWYRDYLKRPFPRENICFGIAKIMQRLSSGELQRGDILIFEEAGANMGSLDFQNRVSKMFVYVLQSFRSMNIGVFFNLPYLSMLNKQARMLLHYSFESAGIDFNKKVNKSKPLFNQVNQITGKIYRKYMRVRVNGTRRTVKRFAWEMPSEEIMNYYEAEKQKFLTDMTTEYTKELEVMEADKLRKLGRKDLTDKQQRVYDLRCSGLTQKEVVEETGYDQGEVSHIERRIKELGYDIKIVENGKKNG